MSDIHLVNKGDILITRIPTALYEDWLELTYQFITVEKMSEKDAQMKVYGFLRNYILMKFPLHKLCAFEELNTVTAEKLRIERGMYIKLRKMSKEEYALATEMNKENKLGKDGNPQWTLELDHIPELLKLYKDDN